MAFAMILQHFEVGLLYMYLNTFKKDLTHQCSFIPHSGKYLNGPGRFQDDGHELIIAHVHV